MPGEAPRSVIALVGTPETKKYASSLPSLMALVLSAGERRSRARKSLSRSRPAPSMSRSAMTSVAEPGAPVEMRLPFMSAIDLMPLAAVVTTCMRLV